MLPPSPCSIICCAASCVLNNSQPKFARMTASHPRAFVSRKSARNVPPATFTSTSRRPKCSMQSANVCVRASASRTSISDTSGASFDTSVTSATVVVSSSSLRSHNTSFMPARA